MRGLSPRSDHGNSPSDGKGDLPLAYGPFSAKYSVIGNSLDYMKRAAPGCDKYTR
jgi:hypothetical protein